MATILRAWTDRATPDPFVVVADGRAHFRPGDLCALAALVAQIREAADTSDVPTDV